MLLPAFVDVPPPASMLETCIPHHDWFNALLTFCLCCGLVISYLPQHFRIIHAKSSEGFSPVFLLLGTTSAASGMLNMVTLQAPIVRCCRVVSLGSCVEMTAGVVQVGLQWFCFSIVFVLYMIYYPERLKYLELDIEEGEEHIPNHVKTPVRSEEWRLSIILAWTTVAHFFFAVITTAYLLITVPNSPNGGVPPQISLWATFLGVSSAMLAMVQYAPQLLHTYRTKLVGALSIPMMMIQTPGGILMVTSIVLRPGTNWTSWITFALAAVLQGCLLAMCIAWKIRQRKLDIDDFGNPLSYFPPAHWSPNNPEGEQAHDHSLLVDDTEPVPGLVTTPSEDPIAVRKALTAALESAAEGNLLSPGLGPSGPQRDATTERTPLLRRSDTNGSESIRSGSGSGKSENKGWQAWFGR
ncbi:hypothetical protein GALMADRAFT_141041 [Galerina marginata CBS 339.88]|uniref:Uncharacterized protein n=1 Tax=Galerina marginata (strain CBS 339.88) TaxID=685588 RepID=A0A067SX95_GALM3|nr:hypothetical protein GALMADRAFT_141041 [Galerina marginata CBS 339.88]